MPGSRLTWYAQLARRVAVDLPVRTHLLASGQAATAAARTIRSSYTGSLARDLSRPRFLGPMHSRVGSSKRYARIEARGGTIRPRNAPFLMIHGRRIGARGQGVRSTFGGPVVATVGPGRGKGSVYHRGKHWDVAAVTAFHEAWIRTARSMWSSGR